MSKRKPLIGITCNQDHETDRTYIGEAYLRAVEAAGGIAVLLPLREAPAGRYCRLVDGLLLSGGVDLDPFWFGEDPMPGLGKICPDRDAAEIALTREALTADKPLLAVCRGLQVVNVAAGGTIYQDLRGQVQNAYKHTQEAPRWYPTHGVEVLPDSKLSAVMGPGTRVNSFHHQAIKDVAPGFRITARAGDGVIEAIESERHRFILGVQWHPEDMFVRDSRQLKLFRMLVAAASGVG
ncbi:MAG: gamma-glutamyl-gamma-aminobutyrate hydrolase family protein [Bacillota bacterium]